MEEVVQEKQMQACLDGYARFLTRKKLKDNNSDDDEDDEATYDVDVMWYAGQPTLPLALGGEKTSLNGNAHAPGTHTCCTRRPTGGTVRRWAWPSTTAPGRTSSLPAPDHASRHIIIDNCLLLSVSICLSLYLSNLSIYLFIYFIYLFIWKFHGCDVRQEKKTSHAGKYRKRVD
jgi:hypothetical protein